MKTTLNIIGIIVLILAGGIFLLRDKIFTVTSTTTLKTPVSKVIHFEKADFGFIAKVRTNQKNPDMAEYYTMGALLERAKTDKFTPVNCQISKEGIEITTEKMVVLYHGIRNK